MSFTCEFCKKEFTNKYILNNHKNTTKKCLEIQELLKVESKKIMLNKCGYCYKSYTTKQTLNIHLNTCKERKCKDNLKDKEIEILQNTFQTLKKEKDKEIEILKNTFQTLKKEKDKEIEILKKEKDKELEILNNTLELLKKENENYKEQVKDLLNKLDKIANKAIDRPTTTNNTVNNKIELYPFPSQKEIDNKIESQFNDKYLWDGMKGLAQFVYDHIIKLEDGSIAYACFDRSRQIFKYKDENGNEIKDPKAVKLRKMIKPGLLRQSQTLLDYFNDECDYLEKRKNNGIDIDRKEYNTMNILREKAFEVGAEILSIDDTNKFGSELANLSC